MEIRPELLNKLDEAIRAGLKADRDWYFICLVACTVVVIVGLIMEGIEYLPHPRPRLNPATGVPIFRWRLIRLSEIVVISGWFFVAAGVAGEGVFEWLSSAADGELQEFNDILLGDTQKQAGSAFERAGNASITSGLASRDAASANERSARLTKDNLVLQTKILDLQEKFAWRTITEPQSRLTREVLGAFRGQEFDIDRFISDPESVEYSDEIRASLVAAGWIPHDLGGYTVGSPFAGVLVRIHRDNPNLQSAAALVRLWRSREFNMRSLFFDLDDPANTLFPMHVGLGHIAIHVGRKPP